MQIVRHSFKINWPISGIDSTLASMTQNVCFFKDTFKFCTMKRLTEVYSLNEKQKVIVKVIVC